MKKLLSILLLLGIMLCFLCSCRNTPTDNIPIEKKIAQQCGHKSSDGAEYSYDLILKTVFSYDNVRWSSFEYEDLEQTHYTRLRQGTPEFDECQFNSESAYAIATVKHEDGKEENLIFCFDETTDNVIACVNTNGYLESWYVYEKTFCYYYCKCNR